MEKIQAVKGMRDVNGELAQRWYEVETTLSSLATSYGYQPLRLPILESTSLFKRSIGDATDIVEKEMYTFSDRRGHSLTLRPEGTAGCVRAGINHQWFDRHRRCYYHGPMFRYERPQKGRYRQFEQVGLEIFGISGAAVEAELIQIAHDLWHALGLQDHVVLQLNSLGQLPDRQRYRQTLVDYFHDHLSQLDDDSVRRLQTNPLRILDSKVPSMQPIIERAPRLADHLSHPSQAHHAQLLELLTHLGINYEINPRLVRGLDYYNETVFEWVTDCLGAQGTVCAGGRYDGLVAQLGGPDVPAVGCAFGTDRVVETWMQVTSTVVTPLDVYVVAVGSLARAQSWQLVRAWRRACPGKRMALHGGDDGFKSQLKQADKSGAPIALILGDDEIQQHQVQVKWLKTGEQQAVSIESLPQYLDNKVFVEGHCV